MSDMLEQLIAKYGPATVVNLYQLELETASCTDGIS